MKILYVMTISGTLPFFPEHFKMLLKNGHTVEIACNCEGSIPQFCVDLGLKAHHISFSRSPFSRSNLAAFFQLKKLVRSGNYDIVHTHTPNASAIVRLACRKLRKQGLKVFYTAHGFHFFKGAPLKNWLIYYPVEWLCAHWTDLLITINTEDYALAKKHMHARRIEYVPGVGIDIEKFSDIHVNRAEKRKELSIPEDATLLISVGELNENKNHETVIRAIRDMDVYYIIAGSGSKKEYLQCLINELKLTDRVRLLGHRTDAKELYAASDVFVFPSFREGLSVSLMEAMVSGLPCAVSKIRGNIDLIDEKGGFLFDPSDIDSCRRAICGCLAADSTAISFYNRKKIENFSIKTVSKALRKLYSNV